VKYHYLANPQTIDGDDGLHRVEIAPKGASRAHFRRAMSEAFFELSGTARVIHQERQLLRRVTRPVTRSEDARP
jgi:hypothetical protein